MKSMKFRQTLIQLILDGKKRTTWRLFDDKNLAAGDIVSFIVWETKEEAAKARLIDVQEKTFMELTESDWEGHDRFQSDEEMYSTFSKYYGRDVSKDSHVKIIRFELM
ncbi:MAG: ASCH domain-containing protein [Nanoarchaeota archaeon]